MSKNRGLGKGLGALIPELEEEHNPEAKQFVDINSITPNPYQPRKEFSDEKLNELAESIRLHGVIQPLLVREYQGKYQLIAGERRLRASKIVGLSEVPIVIRDMTDQTMMEVALIENLQREDLNIIEEAEAYRRLMEEFSLTQEEIAKQVGRSRPAIANTLRLLNLPSIVQSELAKGTLTMGHARPLLSLNTTEEQIRVWQTIQNDQLSVRQTEELIKQLTNPEGVSRETKKPNFKNEAKPIRDPNLIELEEELQLSMGTKVIIKPSGSGGKIEINYYSDDDFERICEKLTQE
ncbi:MAG: ParB/RepB/Spo0J family partition protein [Firmicutes bacterium]|mgnify:CR=1 FL=1|nr:ParB/RepB/Spo0J family partition protein [Bacillota bacterium]